MVCSNQSLPICGAQVFMIESCTTEIMKDQVDLYQTELQDYAKDICKEAVEIPLPPLHATNHVIPLINEHQVYICLATVQMP